MQLGENAELSSQVDGSTGVQAQIFGQAGTESGQDTALTNTLKHRAI